jgi:hypothetical protein
VSCETENNLVQLTVHTNAQSDGSPLYLFAHTRGAVKTIQQASVQSGSATFRLRADVLGEGISDLVIFDNDLRPVCERLFFRRPAPQLSISFPGMQKDFHTRQQVHVPLAVSDVAGKSSPADLSITAYLVDSLQRTDQPDIRSYLWLSSDLRGTVENPGYYFSADDTAGEMADLLMMTQGWRRFEWKNLLNEPDVSPAFLPETQMAIVHATISDKRSGRPVAGALAYFSIPGSRFYLAAGISDALGHLSFSVNNVYGTNEAVIQPANADSNYRVDIDNNFSNQYANRRIDPLILSSESAATVVAHSLSTQVQQAFYTADRQYLRNTPADSTAFFGTPDKKYFLDDYTRFTTMEEVIREYVPDVRLRKRDGEFHFLVKNLPYGTFFDLDPLILLDGVPVFNADPIVSMDPLKIKSLEVVTRSFYTGPASHAGIVSFTTYDGTLGGFSLPASAIVKEYPGLLYERSFYSPAYETAGDAASRIPDFRNVLYWNPSLNTGTPQAWADFFTSDIPGNYLISVEGIAKDGSCGTGSTWITVHK